MTGPRIGSLFSGYGGLDMGVQAAIGGEVAWHVEYEAAPSKILAYHWPDVPNYGDITQVDWSAVEPVDVLTGGFPCQDLSLAGRRAGMRTGTRSGLWADYLKAIDVLRPQLVVIENVRGLLSGCAESDLESCPGCVGESDEHRPVLRALGRVIGDLAGLGYDAIRGGLRAADAGAPHGRYRVFVIAYPQGQPWGVDHGDDVSTGSHEIRRADSGDRAAADAEDFGYEWPGSSRDGRDGSANDGGAVADTRGARFGEHPGEPSAQEARTQGGHVAASDGERRALAEWGPFAPALERWGRIIGRPVPGPRDERGQLAVLAEEFMMGLPLGHVSSPEIGITDNEARRALGNGVVPQQATLATRTLLDLRSHSNQTTEGEHNG